MTNIRTLLGTLLVAAMVILGGWAVWRSVATVPVVASSNLVPLTITADQIATADGLSILGSIYDNPTAQFELPVPRPDQASVGKQNLFQ